MGGYCWCLYRNRILQDIDRFIHPEQVINRVVYCLDDVVSATETSTYTLLDSSPLNNFDEHKFVYFSSLLTELYLLSGCYNAVYVCVHIWSKLYHVACSVINYLFAHVICPWYQ